MDEQYLMRGADGEPEEIVGSWRNITVRREAEQASNAARARFDLSATARRRWFTASRPAGRTGPRSSATTSSACLATNRISICKEPHPDGGAAGAARTQGFAEPIHRYKVLGLYDDLAREVAVIREE